MDRGNENVKNSVISVSLCLCVEVFSLSVATITHHNLDKTPKVSGVLQGIKGQYLIFDNGVMNIRKYGGYKVKVTV